MTLYTSDYLEYYLTLVGWIVHNGIWSVLGRQRPVCAPVYRDRHSGMAEGTRGGS